MIQQEKIAHSFLWKLLERFSAQAISIVVTILLARILLPEEYGIIAIIVVFINIANVIIDGGLNTALIQKKNADEIDFSTILYFSLALAAIIYLLFFFSAQYIARFYNNSLLAPVLRILSLNLFFNSFNAVQRAYVSKHMLFDRLFYCSSVAILLSGITGIAMAYQGLGVWALVGQQLVNQITLTVIMWLAIRWRPILAFSFQRFKKLFDYGWKIFLTNLIIAVYEDIRSLIIGKLYQPSTLAYFDRGKQFPNLIMSNINVSLQTVLLPAFADIQEERQRVKQMMQRSIQLTNFFIMPLLVGLLVAARPFVILLLTEKWLDAVPFIQIFCIAYMMIPIQSANMSAIKALGYSDITLKLEIIKKFLEAVILVISILIGVYAIAWGIVLYNFLCIIINLYPCQRLLNYGIREQLRDVVAPTIISCTMGFSIYWFTLTDWPPSVQLSLQILCGPLIYFCLHAVFRTTSYSYILTYIKNRLKKNHFNETNIHKI